MKPLNLRILETSTDLLAIEDLQRQVWTGSDIEIVPVHLLLAAVHNGGLIIAAYETATQAGDPGDHYEVNIDQSGKAAEPLDSTPVGFVFGFPGLYSTPDGPRTKHHSHMLGVLPSHRDRGVGFLLKRAQWQMVRHQGLDRITWTYDPLLSRNAHLNISRLGGVCSTYINNYYGEMRDELNAGLPTDRFQVDWWVNSRRVIRRLSRRPRLKLDLAHFLAAGTRILNPTRMSEAGLPRPVGDSDPASDIKNELASEHSLMLLEIPADFIALKTADPGLAHEWRYHTRSWFETLFENGYLVTDFVHLPGTFPRSFYVLSYGDSTL
jgi:predicted GNAT superfamily acetyltransferase